MGKTLFRKVWDAHTVRQLPNGQTQLFIGLHLIHEVTTPDALDAAVNCMVESLLANGPKAMAEAKALIRAVAGRPIEASLNADTAGRIARIRASGEGREGGAAFLGKRKPDWTKT